MIELQQVEIDGSSFCGPPFYVGFVENCLFRWIITGYWKREEQVFTSRESSESWVQLGERTIRP